MPCISELEFFSDVGFSQKLTATYESGDPARNGATRGLFDGLYDMNPSPGPGQLWYCMLDQSNRQQAPHTFTFKLEGGAPKAYKIWARQSCHSPRTWKVQCQTENGFVDLDSQQGKKGKEMRVVIGGEVVETESYDYR